MTRIANDDRDKPFSDWLRKNPDLDSIRRGIDVTDIDFVFHKYKSQVDGQGTRDVKLMMDVEVKTWGKKLSDGQAETLFFRHQLLNSKGTLQSSIRGKTTVWHFGQFVVILHGGDRPDVCSSIEWGIFDTAGKIILSEISESKLVEILGFYIRPDNFEKLTLRRHHKTQEFGYVETKDMLFPIAKHIIKRS